jgi:hypothetical protein
VLLDVPREQLEEAIGHVDDALTAILRCADLYHAAGALHLPSDREGAAEEVDVADLQGGRLAEPQPSERGDRNERPEARVGCREDCGDLLGRRQDHRRFAPSIVGEWDPFARVCRDETVPHRRGQHRPGLSRCACADRTRWSR